MPNIPDKTDGQGQFLTAVELNPFKNSLQNAITDAGGTLIASDSLQFRQALNSYTSIANFYIDTGTATEYVLNPQGAFKAPIDASTTWNGMLIRFRPTNNNTGVATLRLAGLNGGLPFNTLREDGTAIQAGDFLITKDAILRYNSTADAFMLLTVPVRNASQTVAGISYLPKTIVLSNNILNPNTQIDYSEGIFNFSDGSGSGSVTAGSVNITTFYPTPANNKGYYIFAVKNLTTNTTTVIIDVSKTSPTLPSGFTKKKYLGALMTNGAGQIRAGTYLFKPDGTYHFTYDTSIQDAFHQNDSGAFQNYSITIPNITGLAYVQTEVSNDTASAYPFIFLYQASKPNNIIIKTQSSDTGNSSLQGYIPVLGNSQIAKSWGGNSSRRVYQHTLGWVDYVI